MKKTKTAWSYNKTGINVSDINRNQKKLDAMISRTYNLKNKNLSKVVLGSGHYSSLLDLGNNRLIAFHTDGVGTKVLIAQMMRKFDTIGIDCVAMNVNDIICVGARPVSLVDYIALQKMNKKLIEKLIIGLVKGAKLSDISLIGGETAILPDVISGYDGMGFDLAASCIGVVEKKNVVLGNKIKKNDVIIGIHSSGLHSNGITLARKILLSKYNVRDVYPNTKDKIGNILLTPTLIYSKSMESIFESNYKISGLAHITGGSFTKLDRLISKKNLGVKLTLPEKPFIFEIIQKEGNVSDLEMYRTFNMGVGFCIVCPKNEASGIINQLHSDKLNSEIIGKIVDSKGIIVNGKKIR